MAEMEVGKILKTRHEIIIYSRKGCKLCTDAKARLSLVELPFQEGDVDKIQVSHPLPDWRERRLHELLAMWAFSNYPVPFIVVDGKGYPSVADALSAVNYATRRRIIEKRNQCAKES